MDNIINTRDLGEEMEETMEELPIDIEELKKIKVTQSVNMNKIVGSHDILFICLDTLRYDVAKEEEEKGNTPVLSKYGPWIKCHAPGNFTYPSHMAMFAGFLPTLAEPMPLMKRERLFLPKTMGMRELVNKEAFTFDAPTFIEGLAMVGYETICIGGVGFFNKRDALTSVMPGYFKQSYWTPKFRCGLKSSTKNQVDFAIKKLEEIPSETHTMMYINVSAIHYPNGFYIDQKDDTMESHAAALRYVDGELNRLFETSKKRNPTFVIVCSDHGTCYGEDNYRFHGVSHEAVNTVPYKHFIL